MDINRQKEFIIKSLYVAIVVALAYIALKLLSGVLFPFAAAALLTIILQGFIRKWTKKLKLKKKPASVAIMIFIYALIGVLVFMFFYIIYHQLLGFLDSFPKYSAEATGALSLLLEKIRGIVTRLFGQTVGVFDGMSEAAVSSFTEKATGYLTGLAGSVVSALPFFFLSVAVMIIASAYFAKDYDEITRFIIKNVSKENGKRIIKFKRSVIESLAGMFRGYLVIMTLTFAEVAIGLMILKVNYSVIIALLVAIVDILPVLGSGTVLVPWALFCVFTGNIPRAIGLIVLYVVVTIIRNIFEPKIIGKRVGLHPLIMLIAVFLGLKFFGAAGIVMLPVAIIVSKEVFSAVEVG